MKLEKLFTFLLQIYLFSCLFSQYSFALSPDSSQAFPKYAPDTLNEFIDSDKNIRNSKKEELRIYKQRQKRKSMTVIALLVSIFFDGFLALSLVVFTFLSHHGVLVPMIAEIIVLVIDVITLVLDLILAIYSTIQIMNEPPPPSSDRSQEKPTKKIKILFFVSLFSISPLMITPIFFSFNIFFSIFLWICSGLAVITYMTLSYQYFFKENLRKIKSSEDNYFPKKFFFSFLKLILLTLVFLIVLCIIPIFSHLSHLQKYLWLLCAIIAVFSIVFVFSDNTVKKILKKQSFRKKLSSDLKIKNISDLKNKRLLNRNNEKSINNLFKNEFQKLIDNKKFDKNVISFWNDYNESFDSFIKEYPENDSLFLCQIKFSHHIWTFFFNRSNTSLIDIIHFKKALKLLHKNFKTTIKQLSETDALPYKLALEHCKALRKMLTLDSQYKYEKEKIYSSALLLRSA